MEKRQTTTIRAVTDAADTRTVVLLAREIWNEHYVPIIGRDQVEYMLGRYQSEPAVAEQIREGTLYFLLLDAGSPAGYFAVVPDRASRRLLLGKLYVLRGLRQRGIARAGVEHAEKLARAMGLNVLWLRVNKNNRLAIQAYERMGFATTGAPVQEIGEGFVMDDFQMEKKIRGKRKNRA